VRVVPIYFADDAIHAEATQSLHEYAASPYWAAQTGEYGVGALTVADEVVLADPAPATSTDSDLVTRLTGLLDGTHPELGPVDPGALATTVFAVHFPDSAQFTMGDGSRACDEFGGYHDMLPHGGDHVSFAAVFECTSDDHGLDQLDHTSLVDVHELVEAATDPLPGLGWVLPNPEAAAFAVAGGGPELGDVCAPLPAITPAGLSHAIPRTWSNAAAAGFHDPCVPSDGGPYFAAVPEQLDTALIDLGLDGTQTVDTQLDTHPVTVTVDLLSDGETDDWTVEAFEPFAKDHRIELALDRTTGRNGEHVHLTIKPVGGVLFDTVPYGLRSTIGTRSTVWYGVVVP
jgi:hypothetical protein